MRARALWVARHAPVAVENLCYGQSDVATRISTEDATARLRESFASFREAPPDVVWSSTAARCRLVGGRLAAMWGSAHEIDESLCELNFGTWEGRTWTEIALEDATAYEHWLRDWQSVAPPHGERPNDLTKRVRAWFEELEPARVHALVAHAGVVRALCVIIEGHSWPAAMERSVDHLSWTSFALSTTFRDER